MILFWQFTIKTLDELDIVSNQHLSIEMFLMRLIYLKGPKQKNEFNFSSLTKKNQDDEFISYFKNKTIRYYQSNKKYFTRNKIKTRITR